MPIAPADWTITRATGAIRYIGQDHATFGSPGLPASYATVIEMHRFLQDLADDQEWVGDDQIDITVDTPSDRSTDNIITLINGFNIDDDAAEHLYDGSIIQSGGNTVYDGIVNFGNATVRIQIHQNGAILADDWWNLSGPGSPNTSAGLNADSQAGISHRFMIKVRDGGVDIDGRRLVGQNRTFGNTYGEFSINGTSNGNNVLALSDATDLNNASTVAAIGLFDDVANTVEGYNLIDVEADGVPEAFYSAWDYGTRTVNDFYERLKYLSKDTTVFGSPTDYLYGLPGEQFRGPTHQLAVDAVTGPWSSAYGLLEWGSPRTGSGQVLAHGSAGSPVTLAGGSPITTVWIQLLTGVIPVNDQIMEFKGNAGGSPQSGFGSPGGGTATLDITVTERTLSTPFVGQSTGSALIGAYGLGVVAADLVAADTVFDLANAAINPPNNVTFTVQGLEIGEDRVLVVPAQGTAVADGIDQNQLTLATTLSGANETSAVTTTAIPTDTPAAGTIRITTDANLERYIVYSAFTGSTFTIGGAGSPTNGYDFSGDNATVVGSPRPNVYISYIDKLATSTSESFQVIYNSDRVVFVRVRDGGTAGDLEGIKTFETTGTVGSTGGSATAIRTPDA